MVAGIVGLCWLVRERLLQVNPMIAYALIGGGVAIGLYKLAAGEVKIVASSDDNYYDDKVNNSKMELDAFENHAAIIIVAVIRVVLVTLGRG